MKPTVRNTAALLAGACLLALAACGSDDPAATAEPAGAAAQAEPTGSATPTGSAATGLTGSLAPASPVAGENPVLAVDIAQGQQDKPVDVEVDGGEAGVGVTFREITLEPGSSTGEHCHYGQLIAVVREGDLTHYADIYPGGVHVYETGDSIIEGPGYPHEGRNEGDENVVLMVTYVTPEGKPLAETELTNCD